MRLLMSTLNMELELSTKSASDVHCGFLAKSLNFRFGCCLFLVSFFFFSAFDFFFWRNVWTVMTSLKHSLVVSTLNSHPRKLSGRLEKSVKKSSSSVPILVRDIFVSS